MGVLSRVRQMGVGRFSFGLLVLAAAGFAMHMPQHAADAQELPVSKRRPPTDVEVQKSDKQWRSELTPQQFKVLRRKATERPFTGEYLHSKDPGIYQCAGCKHDLFDSSAKYNSGTGWPSFWIALDSSVRYAVDRSDRRETRIEVMCDQCGSHLGHVFADGPPPTYQRYCINSLALQLVPFGTPNADHSARTKPAAVAKVKPR